MKKEVTPQILVKSYERLKTSTFSFINGKRKLPTIVIAVIISVRIVVTLLFLWKKGGI